MPEKKTLDYYVTELRRVEESRQKNSEKEIKKIYKEILKELNSFISNEYVKYSNKDGNLSVAILQEKSRYAKFLQEVEQNLNSVTPKISKAIKGTVEDTYKAVYTGMIKAVKDCSNNEELNKRLKDLDLRPEVMKRAIENPISGLTLPDILEKYRKEVIYNIKQQINIGLMTGERYDTMAKNINKVISGDNGTGGCYGKAINIARTECHRVQESGLMDCAEDIAENINDDNLIYAATWRTMKDQRVRPQVRIHTSKGWKTKTSKTKADHQKMEGVTIKVGEQFEIEKGVFTKSPGNSGTARNDINCRCFLEYSLMTVEEFAKKTGKSVEEIKEWNSRRVKKDTENSSIEDKKKNIEDTETFKNSVSDDKKEFTKSDNGGIIKAGKGLEIESPTDHTQNYKPVIIDKGNQNTFRRNGGNITVSRLTNAKNKIYISDEAKLKPKQQQELDRNIATVLNLLKIEDKSKQPVVAILSDYEMTGKAVAAYAPIQNVIYVRQALLDSEKLLELQEQLACSNNRYSTLVHEYIHWLDAEEYRKKHGKFNNNDDYKKYIKFLNNKCKTKLDNAGIDKYNVGEISEYADRSYRNMEYDETYTEYRVLSILKGK